MLLASYAMVLGQRQTELAIGVPVSQRHSYVGGGEMVGCFVNTQVVRLSLAEPSHREGISFHSVLGTWDTALIVMPCEVVRTAWQLDGLAHGASAQAKCRSNCCWLWSWLRNCPIKSSWSSFAKRPGEF